MKVDPTNIVKHLQELTDKIGDEVSSVNEKELVELIQTISNEVNRLRNEIMQQKSDLDPAIKKVLDAEISKLKENELLTQALGHHQSLLFGALNRYELAIEKFKSKVNPIEKSSAAG